MFFSGTRAREDGAKLSLFLAQHIKISHLNYESRGRGRLNPRNSQSDEKAREESPSGTIPPGPIPHLQAGKRTRASGNKSIGDVASRWWQNCLSPVGRMVGTFAS